jgi:stage V sporulation protein B
VTLSSVSDSDVSDARNAGRGGIAVLGAKVFFVLAGLLQQTVLPRAIGLAGYGALALVLAPANILNNVVVASSTQGVSRAVARAPGAEREAFWATMRVHAPLAVAIAALFAAAAPLLAWFEGTRDILVPLAVISLVTLLYGLYAPMIGLLNGRAQFARQAGLDVTFAIVRTAGLIGVGWLFMKRGQSGVLGSALGFVLAVACILPVAVRAIRAPRANHESLPRSPSASATSGLPRPKEYLGELWPLAAAQLCTNAVMQVDIMLLGHFLSLGAPNPGLGNEWAGVYRACQLFAFLPYQLLLSITQILFPMVARAKAEGDRGSVRRYVERGARLAALACGMMVAVIVAMPSSLLAFAYSGVVAERGGGTLRILALGQGAYTMLAIATTVLASLGRERMAARIMLCALGGVLGGCALLTMRAGFGADQLTATALGTSLALFLALIVGALAVRKEAGGFLPARTIARVLIAVASTACAGMLVPRVGRLAAPGFAAAFGVLYLAVLLLTGELTREDAVALRSLRKP